MKMSSWLCFGVAARACAATARPFGYRAKDDGKSPLMEIGDPRTAFVEAERAGAGGVYAAHLPADCLLATWRKLGVRVLQKVAFEPRETPEHFRRRCGFAAYLQGADGVYLDHPVKSLPDLWKRALKEALADAKLLRRLDDLIDRARASDDRRHVSEGRIARHFLTELDVTAYDPDSLKVEAACLVRHLEKLLDGAPGEIDLTPHPEFAALAGAPFADASPANVAMRAGVWQSVADGVFVAWDETGRVRLAADAARAPLEISLHAPARRCRGEWSRWTFRWEVDPEAGPRVDTSCLDRMSIGLEPRFAVRSGVDSVRTVGTRGRLTFVPSRCICEDYPPCAFDAKLVEPSDRALGFKDCPVAGRVLLVDISPNTFFGLWPASVPEITDRWFVETKAAGLPDGRALARLAFPKGTKVLRSRAQLGVDLGDLTATWDAANATVDWLFRRGDEQRFRVGADTGLPRMMDAATDRMFVERILDPAKAKLAVCAEMTRLDRGHQHPSIRKQPDAARASLLAKAGGMLTYVADQVRARREYLLLRLAGKEPPPPAKPAAAKREKGAGLAPEADEPSINLDEEF